MLHDGQITDKEVEALEALRNDGEFSVSLQRSQESLAIASNDEVRMRLLFNIAFCAERLEQYELVEFALTELDHLPQPEISRVLVNIDRAWARTALGRPQDALHLLDMSLATGLFEARDMRIHKYRLLLNKGEALVHLRRSVDALESLDSAHALFPMVESTDGPYEPRIFRWVEPNIQINRANCLLALSRFDESFDAAQAVTEFDHPELSALALQYMAEGRAWQGRTQDALKLYAALQPKLPCRLVDEKRIREGMDNCMRRLEQIQQVRKPV